MAQFPNLLDGKRAFHVNEAISAYGLSRTTIYKLIKEGRLRTVKVAGRRLIPRDSLEALLQGAVTNADS
jgi:excisionase family DNA binding protein